MTNCFNYFFLGYFMRINKFIASIFISQLKKCSIQRVSAWGFLLRLRTVLAYLSLALFVWSKIVKPLKFRIVWKIVLRMSLIKLMSRINAGLSHLWAKIGCVILTLQNRHKRGPVFFALNSLPIYTRKPWMILYFCFIL